MEKTVFAFDVGLASLGVAVNVDDDIEQAKSLLIHETAGCTKAQAERRGAFRRKRAHKEREKILEEFWLKNVGREGFLQRKSFKKENGKWIKTVADERLEKEFPGKDEGEITYASSLLRIQLLEGEKLEKWQIYKALHASIQRRGYDDDVPWKNREIEKKKEKKKDDNSDEKTNDSKKDKDKEPEELVRKFEAELKEKIKDSKYHYPCYLDAYYMGLWDNEEGIIAIRQDEECIKEKSDYTASRKYVEEEVSDLLKAAAKQIPKLKPFVEGNKLNHLLWGKGERKQSLDDKYPSEKKIGGLLAQKYPRFDNRIVAQCCLIGRLNVCKSSKKLAIEVGFLMRLCNFRYESISNDGEIDSLQLPRKQIKDMFDECLNKWKKWEKNNKDKYDAEEYAKCFKMTNKQLEKEMKKLPGGEDQNKLKAGHTEIEQSKTSGRSRFSQPALYILKKLILSVQTSMELYEDLQNKIAIEKEKNPQSKFGYKLFNEVPYCYKEDDFWFLKEMDNPDNKIYIPDMSLARKYGYDINEKRETNKSDITGGVKDSAVQKVISSCNWPVVRHRLGVFYQELKNLVEDYGIPDTVHIEFVREDFMGDKRKAKYTQQSKQGRKNYRDALEEIKEIPTYRNKNISEKDIKKYRLFKEQDGQCPYTGKQLCKEKLPSYEIDHIFPEEEGGPDAYYNIVLTTRETNKDKKGKKLPCQCDFIDWNSYRNRIEKSKKINKEKKSILLASKKDEAEELIEKYTPLHATSYEARLARDIACITFDWQPGAKDKEQKVFVFSGAVTSRVAKKYKLYRALGNGQLAYTKDREDDRHHALDAMVISYLRQYTRDKNKTDFFKLPEGKNCEYFSKKLAKVNPYYITRTKQALTEEPYQAENKEKLREISTARTRKDDKRKLTDKKKARNLSKDPDEQGQWYKNKQNSKEGTFQHGYLFYFEETLNKSGKSKKQLKHKTIHSFDSPYQIEEMLKRKGYEIHGLFHQKQRIKIGEQKKYKSTRLGRELPYIKYGIYRIETLSKAVTGSAWCVLSNLENEKRIRIKLEHLHKIKIINNILSGQDFPLKKYLVKVADEDEKQEVSGEFHIGDFHYRNKSAIIVDSNNTPYAIDSFDKLVNDLYKTYSDEGRLSEMLEKGELIQLGQFLPYLKDGQYTIKRDNNRYSLESGNYTRNMDLSALLKLNLIDKHIVKKESFELDNYPINEEEQLTGSYNIGKCSWDRNSATVIDSNDNEYPIDLKCLIIRLCKNQTEQEQPLEKNTITIDNTYLPSDRYYLPKYSATEDDLSKQEIKAGVYLLKKFESNAKSITITSQNGTNYSVNSSILEYAEPVPVKKPRDE